MEKYEKAQMEIIEFDTEDVITTSSDCKCNGGVDGPGMDLGG